MFALPACKNLALSGASLGVLAALLLARSAWAEEASAPVQLGLVSVNDNADKNGLSHAPPLVSMPNTSLQGHAPGGQRH
jgi:hypothetical protein